MNCYVCLVLHGCQTQPAFALCERCHVGICADHLIEVTVPPLVGMAGDTSTFPRHRLFCQRCYQGTGTTSHASPSRQQKGGSEKRDRFSFRRWWRKRGPHGDTSDLPSPEEAVEAVEQFFKRTSQL